jgi:hypothetical protein
MLRKIDVTAPVNHTMNTQLDVSATVNPNCTDTATCSGNAPNAYQTNAVSPAQNAGMEKSPMIVGLAMRKFPWLIVSTEGKYR